MTNRRSHHYGSGKHRGAQGRDRGTAHRLRRGYFSRARVRVIASCWVVLALSGAGALAQSGPTIVGFELPHRVQVAPGEIVTLQVVGLKTVLTGPVKASGLPLPTVLAGLSVNFRVYGINLPGPPVAVPLFSIEQRSICGDAPPDCRLTLITIQVPTFGATIVDREMDFAISENGVVSKAFRASGNRFNIRVLTACWDRYGLCQTVPAVTHTDGTLVTADSPASPGEGVIVYATGLGATIPPVPPGQAPPLLAPRMANGFSLQFDFSPNAAPRRPYGNPTALPFRLREDFIGLTPGHVGLYQINVRIPDTIPPIMPCGGSLPEQWPVLSNLTISLSGDIYSSDNFDGAAICVKPPQ